MKARPFRLLSDAALLALLVAPLTGPATAAEYTTLAYGGITCEAWTNARAGKAQDAAVYEAWILGFLSAYNAFVFKGPNVAAGSDFDALRSMVDDHCKERPKDDLDSAAQALIKQLLAKNPPQ
ncbi:MAG TPA: hypothetical protein VKX28_01095 [Xanthobacteraceae bacterium]|nr:hypothetical protein [Xanthobacteraceae bacterium]